MITKETKMLFDFGFVTRNHYNYNVQCNIECIAR